METITASDLAQYEVIDHPGGLRRHYRGGLLHRINGPAVMDPSRGRHEYWRDGLRHRDGGEPAVIDAKNGTEHWVNGALHRDDGPAIARPDGYQAYYQHGVLHRGEAEGAAVINPDGSRDYYENGQHVRSEASWERPDRSEREDIIGRAVMMVSILRGVPSEAVITDHYEQLRSIAWRDFRLQLPPAEELG